MRPTAGLPDFPVAGGCLCGAVRYALEAAPRTVYACHCKDCQRAASGPYAIGMVAWRKDFAVTAGADEVRTYDKTAQSGRVLVHHSCGICDTRLWHDPAGDAAIIIVRAGTLDDAGWLRPAVHIWTSSRLPFIQLDPKLPAYEKQAPSREALYEAWNNLMAGTN